MSRRIAAWLDDEEISALLRYWSGRLGSGLATVETQDEIATRVRELVDMLKIVVRKQ